MSIKPEKIDTFGRYVDAIDISAKHVDETPKYRHVPDTAAGLAPEKTAKAPS
ncbi:MAG: hypothetical protein ACTTJV_09490 [Ottowia sp.]